MARTVEPPAALGPDVLHALAAVSADGLGVLDGADRFTFLNPAGAELLGRPVSELIGVQAPFHTTAGQAVDDGRVATWPTPDGRRRTLRYRVLPLADGAHAVWFSDVTDALLQQERLTAIIRAASRVAGTGSLAATLDAVAQEVVRTATIAAAQIITLDDPRQEIRILGMAGFGEAADFTDRLSACRRLDAHVRFIDAFGGGQPVVVLHRRAAILADPSWAPLHEIMARPDWDSFVAMPLTVRGRTVGVINAYYRPGDDPGPSSLAFLEAMADHAAVAIDTAALLAQTRSQAINDERHRLSRDLHDSVVQQLFSMRMQARALSGRLDDATPDPGSLRAAAHELAQLSQSALADLRDLVFELRPLDLAERGLVAAVRAHAESLEARAGLAVEVRAPPEMPELDDIAMQEDLYRIVQEALHNVVKHAAASAVTVRFTVAEPDDALLVEIADDGRGPATRPPVAGRRTLGLVSMRERAQRWGGTLTAGPREAGGWAVAVRLPRSAHTGGGGAHR